MTYDVGNSRPGLGQAHTSFKLFNCLIFWVWAYQIKEFHKRVVRTKFDIYVCITLKFMYQPTQVAGVSLHIEN
jgi:hypothetical protein